MPSWYTLCIMPILALGALPPGRLIGLYHDPGVITSCSLIEVDFSSGMNRTVATSVTACAGLTESYPSYSSSDGESLFVAINSAASVFSVDLVSGTSVPMGGLPECNDTFPLQGLVWMKETGILTATSLGLFNSTGPGPATQLLSFSGGEVFQEAFLLSSYPMVYLVDQHSSSIVTMDLSTSPVSKSSLKGLPNPVGTVLLNSRTLLQEASYQLYSTSTAGGKAKKILNIPDGPGYPRQNGIAGEGFWWWFDFADLHVADISVKTTQVVGGGFVAAPRAIGCAPSLPSCVLFIKYVYIHYSSPPPSSPPTHRFPIYLVK